MDWTDLIYGVVGWLFERGRVTFSNAYFHPIPRVLKMYPFLFVPNVLLCIPLIDL